MPPMYRFVKRFLDIAIALLGLIALLPLLLCLMALIRMGSRGAALFRQKRVGRHGSLFDIYKLRTMRVDAPHDVATSALENPAAHITPMGRFLRKTSLDELPQLLNVLRGQMSLIGPRPLVPAEKDIHEERLALGAYDVRPGITGWAQVNGRDCVDPHTKAELDAYYAHHVSFRQDMIILFYSVICVVTARGVREGATEFDDSVDERDRPARPGRRTVS
jgi:O-antigen biosynthesis protein WbqP